MSTHKSFALVFALQGATVGLLPKESMASYRPDILQEVLKRRGYSPVQAAHLVENTNLSNAVPVIGDRKQEIETKKEEIKQKLVQEAVVPPEQMATMLPSAVNTYVDTYLQELKKPGATPDQAKAKGEAKAKAEIFHKQAPSVTFDVSDPVIEKIAEVLGKGGIVTKPTEYELLQKSIADNDKLEAYVEASKVLKTTSTSVPLSTTSAASPSCAIPFRGEITEELVTAIVILTKAGIDSKSPQFSKYLPGAKKLAAINPKHKEKSRIKAASKLIDALGEAHPSITKGNIKGLASVITDKTKKQAYVGLLKESLDPSNAGNRDAIEKFINSNTPYNKAQIEGFRDLADKGDEQGYLAAIRAGIDLPTDQQAKAAQAFVTTKPDIDLTEDVINKYLTTTDTHEQAAIVYLATKIILKPTEESYIAAVVALMASKAPDDALIYDASVTLESPNSNSSSSRVFNFSQDKEHVGRGNKDF